MSSGGSRAPGGGAPAANDTPSPQREPEFVPWSRFTAANQEVSQREAGKLAGGVQGSVDRATKGRTDASAANEAAVRSNYQQPKAQAAPSFGSIAQEPAGAFGPSTFDSGVADLAPKAPEAAPAAPAASLAWNNLSTQGNAHGVEGLSQADRLYAFGAVDPDKLNTDVSSGKPVTSGANLAGSNSLESQLGAPAWSKLIGDAQSAGTQAHELGSEAGVQALLGREGPATAFDAALVSGSGGKEFQDLSKKYGGGQLKKELVGANQEAQDRWSKLRGDVDATGKNRDAEIQRSNDEMKRINAVNDEAAAAAQRTAEAAAALPDLESARTKLMKPMAAYSLNGPGSVNGLGNRDAFLNALKTGAQYGDSTKWGAGTPGVREAADAATKALGISQDQLAGYLSKMNDTEWSDFWLLGVIPSWMDGVKGFAAGKPGGWQSPYLDQMIGYGEDGGMWNAVTNMWKDGALTVLKGATGGPLGAVTAGVDAATYKGPGAGQKRG